MDINELQKVFQQNASNLGDYQLMTKTELANGYCDMEESARAAKEEGNIDVAEQYELMRNYYYSALMLRYWYKIFEWAHNSSSLRLELIEFVDWLADSLYVAFYYRTWRWEYEAIVRHGIFERWKEDENGERIPNKYYWRVDPNAPDKIINRCCGSMRGRVYQYNNKDKRKLAVQVCSLNQMVDEAGDSALAFANCVDDYSCEIDVGVNSLVNELLAKDEYIEALIIDGIANHDTYKTKKHIYYEMELDEESGEEIKRKHTRTESFFDSRKLVKHLNQINQNFIRDFCINYSISLEKGNTIYNKLKGLTNPKLYKYIKKTLVEIKQTPQLLDCLT